jgi:F0F1-type ATP synthase membrane subunit b/b'
MDKRFQVKAFVSGAVVIFILLALLAAPAAAFSDGGEHATEQGKHEEHHFDWVAFFGKVFNSVVLFGGLILLLRKPLINLLAQKSIDIKDDIIEREERVKITESQLETIKKRLEKIETEVLAMKENAQKSGEDEQKRIEELGKKEEERILTLTKEEIDNKLEASIRDLKERIADLTIEHFKNDIQTHLDPKVHEKLIEKNIDLISGENGERE